MKRKIITIVCLCCILLLLSNHRAYATEGKLRITVAEGGADAYQYDAAHKTYVITKGGDYHITMGEGISVTQDKIEIKSPDPVSLTLENVHINVENQSGEAAFLIASSARDVELFLSGENTLHSGQNAAGLQKNTADEKRLTIKSVSEERGSLTARGGENAAGIGGANGENILLEGGMI